MKKIYLCVILALIMGALSAQKLPVFLATFDNNNANGWTTYGGTWSLEQPDGNEFHYTYKVVSGSFDKSVAMYPAINDFIAEAKITVRGTDVGSQGSLIFNVTNPAIGRDAFQGYSAGIDVEAGIVWLGKHNNNNYIELGRNTYTIQNNTPYFVKVERYGSTGSIKVYVNGNLEISVTDNQFITGNMIGVRGGAYNTATFDNVIVRNFDDDLMSTTSFSYQNPIANYPVIRDAQIFKEGETYYMTGTEPPHFAVTFGQNNPGVPLYSSKNLITWKFEAILLEPSATQWWNNTFWASEIHKINNRYYLTFNCLYNNVTQGGLAVSDNLIGPYTVLTVNGPWGGYDGTLFQDDDGSTYLFTAGINAVKVNLTNGTIIGNWFTVVSTSPNSQDWDHIGIEGPYVIKRNSIYYCFYSAWTRGYEVGVATASNIMGPWTKQSNNPVYGGQDQSYCANNGIPFTQDPSVPYKAAGHNAVFTGPDGGLWICGHMEMNAPNPPMLFMDPIKFNGNQLYIPSNNPAKSNGPSWNVRNIVLSNSESPYPGPKPATIPGIVEAENYDNGGEGLAYHDNDPTNLSGAYRQDGVDIEAGSEGGYDISLINTGEWLEYSVNVKAIGKFTASIHYAASNDDNKAILYVDDINKSDTIFFPSTGNLQTWSTKDVNIQLNAGKHRIKFFIANASKSLSLDNIEYKAISVVYLGDGTGLLKSLWSATVGGRTWFNDSICAQIDSVVDKDWGDTSPGCGIDKDFWNARWTGEIQALYSETYTFYLTINDIGRLWINNQLIIDQWIGSRLGNTFTGTIDLKAGEKVPVKLDFGEKQGDALIKLEWSSPSNPREVVPQYQLFPSLATSVGTDLLSRSVRIFPNPANDLIKIETNMNVWNYRIIDMMGKLVIAPALINGNSKSVDISTLKQGVYILNITDSKGTISKQLIKT